MLTCGRSLDKLEETVRLAPNHSAVRAVQCDISTEEGQARLRAAIPGDASVFLLVQNAAVGEPARFRDVDTNHLEYAFRVNVVAPLVIARDFLPALQRGHGRILHLGTSIAFTPQIGTTTYGVTKSAFHRLYQQMNVEELGVPTASMSPGLVDTQGVRTHYEQASALSLPHTKFFDEAFEKGWTTDRAQLMQFIDLVLSTPSDVFTAKEWRFSDWNKAKGSSISFAQWSTGGACTPAVDEDKPVPIDWSYMRIVIAAAAAGTLAGFVLRSAL